jgi:hypothetical protein
MIVFVATERFIKLGGHLKQSLPEDLRRRFTTLSYEELLFERAGPIGHYIFTDFDRLSRYEIETVMRFVRALREAAPEARILNHPLQALERTALLRALFEAGINDFDVVRIDLGEKPKRYPAFIRSEDGYGGPETDLFHDEAGFDRAVASLAAKGLPTKGRIAVGYAAEVSPDGWFRKYGCFNLDGEIVPYHIHRQKNWVVKSLGPGEVRTPGRRRSRAEDLVAEEHAYVVANPHREQLERAFAVAKIDYGRADYGIVNGRVQIYEINTNPNYSSGRRQGEVKPLQIERRRILDAKFEAVLRRIESAALPKGRVYFIEERPRVHRVHVPRGRLPVSLFRRGLDFFRRPKMAVEPPAGGR